MTALSPSDNPPTTNVVVLDDFACPEPQALPSPTLTISSPTEPATVSEAQLTVSGTTSDPSGIVSLTLNGALVPVAPDGAWTKQVTLAPGSNAIAVVATNAYGNSSQALRAVTYALPSSTGAGAVTLTSAASGQQSSPSSTSGSALPAVGSETLAPTRFPAAPAGPSALAAKRSFGTRVTYTLNEAASVRFTVLRVQVGRKGSGAHCAQPSPANRHAPACTQPLALRGASPLLATPERTTCVSPVAWRV
jgi:hypothetical protein